MARISTGLLIALSLCALGSPSFAQDSPTPLHADGSIGDSPKTHAKKNAHKNAAAASRTGPANSEEADKAARIAEGRKKFFEQSIGFDHSGDDATRVPITTSSGMPGAAFKF